MLTSGPNSYSSRRDWQNDQAPNRSPSLITAFDTNVRPLIDLIDTLRQDGLDQYMGLPSVVVIGDQSSGKSSILEAISGVPLPRGSGIVTRCPLEMQLKRSLDPDTQWKAELSYCNEHGTRKQVALSQESNIDASIREAQNDIAGNKFGISRQLITLTIYGPNCPDLTLIDLPGIARTVLENQPADICKQIKFLIRDYIERRETIILCVVPVNVDIATNEALTLAREVDPDGSRTLGVLTKPDLADVGTEGEVLTIMNNEKYFLTKGYRIVKCRNQQDTVNGLDLNEAIRQESAFFQGHHIYRKIDHELRGIPNLANALSKSLVEHIKKSIPALREDVKLHLEVNESKLSLLGDAPPKDPAERRLYFSKHSSSFYRKLERVLKGEDPLSALDFPAIHAELQERDVNIAYIWRKHFDSLKIEIESLTSETFNQGCFTAPNIQKKLKALRGSELPGHTNPKIFDVLVKEHIRQYEEPIINCLENICRDLMVAIEYVSREHVFYVASIKEIIRAVCDEVHKKCKEEGRRLIQLEMRKERLVYTQDSTYLKQLKKVKPKKDEKLTFLVYCGVEDTAIHNAGVFRELLKSYIDIVNRRISDNIPALLRTTQFDDFLDLLNIRLQEKSSLDLSEDLIREDPAVMKTRADLEEKIRRLQNVLSVLNKEFY